MRQRITGLLAVATLSIAACTGAPPPAPAPAPTPAPAPESAYTPVVSLNQVMVDVIDHHANELWDAVMTAPRNDDGWAGLRRGAVAIAAAGSLTTVSGNGPGDQRWTQQADWAKYSQALSDAGLSALNAVQAKDTGALSKAGDELVLTCINCHRQYKLDVPKIWTDRQFPPEEQRR